MAASTTEAADAVVRKHYTPTLATYPVRVHKDERRAMYGDVFPPEVVEVNVAVIGPNQSAGSWHGHDHQDDWWFVASGWLRAAIRDGDTLRADYGMHAGGTALHIRSPLWHTYKAGPEGAVLVYGLTNKWDGTDEKRMPFTPEEAEVLG